VGLPEGLAFIARAARRAPGVVDQDVERAPFGDGGGDGALAGFPITDVGGDGEPPAGG
jgi:hypothetical protein